MLYQLLDNVKNNDQNAMLELIYKFKPLLQKYARKLNYDDAYYDLQFRFIELIHNIDMLSLRSHTDGAIVTYISKSVYTQYLRLLTQRYQNDAITQFSQMEDWQIILVDQQMSVEAVDLSLGVLIRTVLTDREHSIIQLLFMHGYTEADIARAENISRQAVSQMKRRALRKLRKYFDA